MNKLYTKAVYVGAKELEGRKVYTYRATTEATDRQGEIVTLDGWEFGNFEKNPVILDSHKYDGIENIVGRAAGPLRLVDGAWEVDILFSESNERGQIAKGLADEGMLNAVSVGFASLERQPGATRSEPLRHTRKELLEISVVPVPANHEALRIRGLPDGPSLTDIAKAFDIDPDTLKAKLAELVAPSPEADSALKGVDFSTALAEAQRRQDLCEMRWDYESALYRVISDALDDAEMSPEDKVAIVDASLGQYHAAMLGWFRLALAAEPTSAIRTALAKAFGPDAEKAGRRLSAKTEATLRACADHMTEAVAGIEQLLTPDTPPAEGDGDQPDPEDPEAGGKAADAAEPVLAVDLGALKAFIGQSEETQNG